MYIRDAGLMHRLLNISDFETLLGHPIVGASWEGFVIENILNHLSNKWHYSYYRTSAQAELDLVLEGPKRQVWAIEVKRSTAPRVTKGFHLASQDVHANKQIVIYPGSECFPLARHIETMGLIDFLQLLKR